MTEDEIFETWAPRDGRWSPWVKPVLFSFVNRILQGQELPVFTGLDQLDLTPTIAVVIDLPGADSIAAGLALAARGWRPVPLFNALPGPSADFALPNRPPVAVDIDPIITALRITTPILDGLHLPPFAPPAFLLDARRDGPDWIARWNTFDNRSTSFPTDFPTAGKLRESGISRVVLIQQSTTPQDDLIPTLQLWQEDNIAIELLVPGPGSQRRPCPIRKATKFGLWWMKIISFFTLKYAHRRAYGGMLIEPSSG